MKLEKLHYLLSKIIKKLQESIQDGVIKGWRHINQWKRSMKVQTVTYASMAI
jgi:hypothetical protein